MITQWKFIDDPGITIFKFWITDKAGIQGAYHSDGSPVSPEENMWIMLLDRLGREMQLLEGKKVIFYDEFPPGIKPVHVRPKSIKYEKEIPATLQELKQLEGLQHYSRQDYIYFLLYYEEIVYVGQTRHIDDRIQAHKQDKVFTDVYWLSVPKNQLDHAEKGFIEQFKPKYNKVFNGFKPLFP